MKKLCIHLIASLLAANVLTADAVQARADTASNRLAQSRQAMGGAKALASVKTMLIKGQRRTPMVRGDKPTSRSIVSRDEIRVLFPDHYLVTYDTPTFPTLPLTREGFAGEATIGSGAMGRWRNPETFGYLMLALLLRTDAVFGFTLRGPAGAVITFRDENGVDVLLDLDPSTHLPQRLRYDAIGRTNLGELTGKRVPTRTEISDYRTVGSLRLPHRFMTYRGAILVTDQQLERIELNPKLTPADFRQ